MIVVPLHGGSLHYPAICLQKYGFLPKIKQINRLFLLKVKEINQGILPKVRETGVGSDSSEPLFLCFGRWDARGCA